MSEYIYILHVEFAPPPIPDRKCDWRAWLDGEEENPLTFGPSKWDALRNLIDKLESHE